VKIWVFIARVIVGGTLLAAGLLKIGHFDSLATTIAAYRIPLLTPEIIAPLSIAIPLFEVLLGAYVLLGLYTKVAAALSAFEFVIFGAAVASVVIRGIPAPCGCFGPGDVRPASWVEVGRDALLALVALSIALYAPGVLALDRRMRQE
jgi:uncharacterized membrane protein YphA (DoxX/SURF4 family)